jgi:hypothetical protein
MLELSSNNQPRHRRFARESPQESMEMHLPRN